MIFSNKKLAQSIFFGFSGCLRPIPHEKSIKHFLSSNEIERPLNEIVPPPIHNRVNQTYHGQSCQI